MRPFRALAALPRASLVRRAPARLRARSAAALPGRELALLSASPSGLGERMKNVLSGRTLTLRDNAFSVGKAVRVVDRVAA